MLEQEKLIAKVKELAVADEAVRAVMMYGSFTQNAGDAYSDVEFYVFVSDEVFAGFDSKGFIAKVAPLYTCFVNNYGTEVAIFQSLIRGEFHFLTHSQMHEIEGFAPVGYFPDAASACLYDAGDELRDYLDALVVNAAAVKRDDAATIESTINNCLNLLLMGINVLRRGEAARAWDTLAQAQTFYVQLLRLHEGVTQHWLNPMKNLEAEISGAAYQYFVTGTAGLYVQDLERAYHSLAENVASIIKKLKVKYGFNFNNELIEKIKNYALGN